MPYKCVLTCSLRTRGGVTSACTLFPLAFDIMLNVAGPFFLRHDGSSSRGVRGNSLPPSELSRERRQQSKPTQVRYNGVLK